MTPNFQAAFDYLLGDEGRKYTNDPDDSGGPTKFGITKATFEAYWQREAADTEIENMTEQTAMVIYYHMFWNPLHLSDVTNVPAAIAIFDCAALYSPKVSVVSAQRALRFLGKTLKVDGFVGGETADLLNDTSPLLFMTAYRLQILERINAIIEAHPKDQKYRNGWTNRANKLLTLVSKQNQGALT